MCVDLVSHTGTERAITRARGCGRPSQLAAAHPEPAGALSVAGSSEKSFDAGGTTYSHIMDPRTGKPVQGVLGVAVLAASATAGDALDNAFFVLGPEGSRPYLRRLPGTEAMFFLPAAPPEWTLVRRRGGTN